MAQKKPHMKYSLLAVIELALNAVPLIKQWLELFPHHKHTKQLFLQSTLSNRHGEKNFSPSSMGEPNKNQVCLVL